MEWRSESWMFNDPCEVCGIRRLDHEPSQSRHFYKSPALPPEAFYDCEFWDIVNDTTGGTVERASHRHGEREPSTQHIWNNSGGDTATLRDVGGQVVETDSYSS